MLPNPLFWKVHMYGIMIAVGVLAAFLVLYGYGKKLKINSKLLDFVYYDAIVSIVLGFGCAALTQAFYDYLEHPENGFHLSGGITFMGGMVGGTALFFLFYALSEADVGIAVNSGAAIAREIADVTITTDDLSALITMKKLSVAAMKRIHGNYRRIMSFNTALIVLGLVGVLPPATSALLHNLSTLAIGLKSMTNLLPAQKSMPEASPAADSVQ